jgi:hypothetical protein
MSSPGQPGASKPARRSRLFQQRPDALRVEEWIPNITLPPPPDTPLEEEEDTGLVLDEHGLPQFEEEPERDPEEHAGPARLFVGMGQRGAGVAAARDTGTDADGDAEDEFVYEEPDDFFVAELRLPRPEDSLPFRIGGASDDDPDDAEFLIDAAEASDPDIAEPAFEAPFTVSLEPPDPVHLGSFGDSEDDDEPGRAGAQIAMGEDDDDYEDYEDYEEPSGPEESSGDLDDLVSGGLPPLTLQPSPARVPLSDRSSDRAPRSAPPPPPPPPPEPGVPSWAAPSRPAGQAAEPSSGAPEALDPTPHVERPKATVVLKSKPFWTRDRRIPEPKPASAPVFQPREAPKPTPIRKRVFTWPTFAVLAGLLLTALILWLVQLAS